MVGYDPHENLMLSAEPRLEGWKPWPSEFWSEAISWGVHGMFWSEQNMGISLELQSFHMAVCQNLVPLVNIKIAGKWMFIPLKMVLIGIDPYPYFSHELCHKLGLPSRLVPHSLSLRQRGRPLAKKMPEAPKAAAQVEDFLKFGRNTLW